MEEKEMETRISGADGHTRIHMCTQQRRTLRKCHVFSKPRLPGTQGLPASGAELGERALECRGHTCTSSSKDEDPLRRHSERRKDP